ncbi:unnamed protein product [Closterium sp. Yama58-4]|nr:unnamed protein product [Closterium sp. Yama58-4]
MQLRKVCCHPFLVEGVEEQHGGGDTPAEASRRMVAASDKLALLERMLERLKAGGHRVLVYSQFKRMLDLLQEWLMRKGWGCERIDGSISGSDRQQRIDRFNAPGSTRFVFLLSTRAGGLGINLATADTVIIYDSDWNPHADLQAMARAHRLGQTQTVMIYRLVTRATVEERMVQMSKKKRVLEHVVVGKLKQSNLNQEELDDILRFGAKELFEEEEEEEEEEKEVKGGEEGEEGKEAKEGEGKKEDEGGEEVVGDKAGEGSKDADKDADKDVEKGAAGDEKAKEKKKQKESRRIYYDDAAIERLLDRSTVGEEQAEDEPDNDYLKAFKVANFSFVSEADQAEVDAEKERELERERQREQELAEEGKRLDAAGRAAYWESLLKDRYEAEQIETFLELGKGRRARRQVDYAVDEGEEEGEKVGGRKGERGGKGERGEGEGDEAYDEDGEEDDGEDGESDVELEEESTGRGRKRKIRYGKATAATSPGAPAGAVGGMGGAGGAGEVRKKVWPLMEGAWPYTKVLGFTSKQRMTFQQLIMRFGIGDFSWKEFVPRLKPRALQEIKDYGALYLKHIQEDPTNKDTFSDGVPKEGVNSQEVLIRLALLHLIRTKVAAAERTREKLQERARTRRLAKCGNTAAGRGVEVRGAEASGAERRGAEAAAGGAATKEAAAAAAAAAASSGKEEAVRKAGEEVCRGAVGEGKGDGPSEMEGVTLAGEEGGEKGEGKRGGVVGDGKGDGPSEMRGVEGDGEGHEKQEEGNSEPGAKGEGDNGEGEMGEGEGGKHEGDKKEGDKKEGDKKEGEKKEGEKEREKEGEKEGEKKQGDKKAGDKEGDKKEGDEKEGDKKEGDEKEGDKKEGDEKEGDKKEGEKEEGEEEEEEAVELGWEELLPGLPAHLRGHSQLAPLFRTRHWRAEHDLLLLKGITKHGYGRWSDIINDDKLGLADVARAELSLPPAPPRNMIGLTLEDIPADPPTPVATSHGQPTNPSDAPTRPSAVTTNPVASATGPADTPTKPDGVTASPGGVVGGGEVAMGDVAGSREEGRAEGKAAAVQEGDEGDRMIAAGLAAPQNRTESPFKEPQEEAYCDPYVALIRRLNAEAEAAAGENASSDSDVEATTGENASAADPEVKTVAAGGKENACADSEVVAVAGGEGESVPANIADEAVATKGNENAFVTCSHGPAVAATVAAAAASETADVSDARAAASAKLKARPSAAAECEMPGSSGPARASDAGGAAVAALDCREESKSVASTAAPAAPPAPASPTPPAPPAGSRTDFGGSSEQVRQGQKEPTTQGQKELGTQGQLGGDVGGGGSPLGSKQDRAPEGKEALEEEQQSRLPTEKGRGEGADAEQVKETQSKAESRGGRDAKQRQEGEESSESDEMVVEVPVSPGRAERGESPRVRAAENDNMGVESSERPPGMPGAEQGSAGVQGTGAPHVHAGVKNVAGSKSGAALGVDEIHTVVKGDCGKSADGTRAAEENGEQSGSSEKRSAGAGEEETQAQGSLDGRSLQQQQQQQQVLQGEDTLESNPLLFKANPPVMSCDPSTGSL